ncbi:diguanylate cyclase domain-containing protein [Deinococcus aquaedulcis]|uniref:diguanylate cyclase domain-containing protein n=1 Tax=Deinococcus aquaedulcis TaxID=2840455 RepID=UPI001C8320B4|nr:diguanylate cyclase [Deinococcus aquaedulcis]
MTPWSAEEEARLAVLSRYQPLVGLPDTALARVKVLAAHLFGVSIVSVGLLDIDQEWVQVGGDLGGTHGPLLAPLGATVVLSGQVVSTGDARQDPRFAGHPLVTAGPHVRFYASAPLLSPEGDVIGALCVADSQVRPALQGEALARLTDMAALVMNELELHLTAQVLARKQVALDHMNRDLRVALSSAETMTAVAELADLDLSPQQMALHVTELTASALDVDWGALVAVRGDRAFSFGAWHSPRGEALAQLASRGIRREEGGMTWEALSAGQPLFVDDYPGSHFAHPESRKTGVQAAATAPLGEFGGTSYLMGFVRLSPQPWNRTDRHLIYAVSRAVRQTLRRAEERAALREAQHRLQLTLDSAPLILWATDLSGTFTLSEGRALTGLGTRPGVAVGQSIYELYAGIPEIRRNVERAMSGEAFVAQVQAQGRVFEARYEPMRNAEGQQTGTVGLAYDVTGLVQAEQQARRDQMRAEALLHLSQLLSGDQPFAEAAGRALGTLQQVLGPGWFVLWARQGQRFVPLLQVGEAPGAVQRHQSQGIPAAQYEALGVFQQHSVFLGPAELPADARDDGMRGAALLPIDLGTAETIWLLGVYRAAPDFEVWTADERQLLEAAGRLLCAGAQRLEQVEGLARAAQTDTLTGLGNRRALDLALERAFAQAHERSEQVTVVSVDMDGLKHFNDTEGHARGDALLVTFGQALREAVRRGDQVFRLGGDEFVVVMVHGHAPSLPAERVQAAVRHTCAAGFPGVQASAGVACFPEDGHTPEAVLACSDARMYAQKMSRRADPT